MYLEFHRGYYDLLRYCTFGVEAANHAQTVWVNIVCRKDQPEQSVKTDTVVAHRI